MYVCFIFCCITDGIVSHAIVVTYCCLLIGRFVDGHQYESIILLASPTQIAHGLAYYDLWNQCPPITKESCFFSNLDISGSGTFTVVLPNTLYLKAMFLKKLIENNSPLYYSWTAKA